MIGLRLVGRAVDPATASPLEGELVFIGATVPEIDQGGFPRHPSVRSLLVAIRSSLHLLDARCGSNLAAQTPRGFVGNETPVLEPSTTTFGMLDANREKSGR